MSKDQLIDEIMSLYYTSDKLEKQWWTPWDDVLRIHRQILSLFFNNPVEFSLDYTRDDYIRSAQSEINRVQKRMKNKAALVKVASVVGTVAAGLLAGAAAGSSSRNPAAKGTASRTANASVKTTPARKFTIPDYQKPDVIDDQIMFSESELDIETHRKEGDSDFMAANRMKAYLDEAQEEHDNQSAETTT